MWGDQPARGVRTQVPAYAVSWGVAGMYGWDVEQAHGLSQEPECLTIALLTSTMFSM